MADWVRTDALSEGESSALAEIQARLQGEIATAEFLRESLADLELAAEDRGWSKLDEAGGTDLRPETRKKIAGQATAMLLVNPLILRGMMLRRNYIWGQDVAISIDDDETGQDVNAVIQRFLEDDRNVVTFSGSAAREDIENLLGTTGEVFYCLPTNIETGEVLVRRIEADEITDIFFDPEDRFTPWYYLRKWSERKVENGTLSQPKERKGWYPALGYYPSAGEKLDNINGDPIFWNQPVRHRAVNKHGRMTRGLGDIYPAMAWARTTKEVLEAWVILFKALARFANQVKGDRAQKAAAAIRGAMPSGPDNPTGAGATFFGGPSATLETVGKSGALLDVEGARWPAMMVASAFGVPVTMLLGDPGLTGARAVAETLDQPTELMARSRQAIHAEDIEAICRYVVRCSIIATGSDTLQGAVTVVNGREDVTLRKKDRRKSGDQSVRVKVDWPDFDSTNVLEKVQAIVQAASTGVVPQEVTLAELLAALDVPDADKIMDANTDSEGKFVPFAGEPEPTTSADPDPSATVDPARGPETPQTT